MKMLIEDGVQALFSVRDEMAVMGWEGAAKIHAA